MASVETATPARLTVPVGAGDHLRGPADAPLTLLEYGDFECPQCRQAAPIVRELERRFAERLRFVFRHFPLTNIHPNAQSAAEAAEWAAAQGSFWPMHDAIYDSGDRLSESRLLDLAAALGGAPASLGEAWRAHSFFPRVKADFRGGLASGVTGTPAFFIDGVRHPGGWDFDSLVRALEAAAAGAQRSG